MTTIAKKQNLSAFYFFLALLVLDIKPCNAIVNMDALHFDENKKGTKGSFSLGLQGSTGNTDKIQLNTDGHIKWAFDTHSDFLLANYQYGESNNTRDSNKSFLHGRHIHDVQGSRLDWELFSQVEQNEFTRLSLRMLFGSGIRVPLHDKGQLIRQNLFGLGAFYSTETYDQIKSLSEEQRQNTVRANVYLLTRYKFTDTTRFFNTFYFQPDVAAFDDFRILLVSSLKVAINKDLDLKASIQMTHDSTPPFTVKETDMHYITAVEYTF